MFTLPGVDITSEPQIQYLAMMACDINDRPARSIAG